jgi:hypothetical protein
MVETLSQKEKKKFFFSKGGVGGEQHVTKLMSSPSADHGCTPLKGEPGFASSDTWQRVGAHTVAYKTLWDLGFGVQQRKLQKIVIV